MGAPRKRKRHPCAVAARNCRHPPSWKGPGDPIANPDADARYACVDCSDPVCANGKCSVIRWVGGKLVRICSRCLSTREQHAHPAR